MKIIKNFTLMLLGLLTLSLASCDVDRIPETSITDPAFWKNESDLKGATNVLYLELPGLPETSDVWSDDAYGKQSNGISDGSRLTPASEDYYGNQYTGIRRANNIMEKSQRVIDEGVEPEVVNWYVAEARFFRALNYFNLLRRYGGVPIILKTLSENSPELQNPKSSREDVLATIYDDLDYAYKYLRSPNKLPSQDYGRVTNTAAMAFKSNVALFEGTRAKFHGYGDPQKHLNIAKQAAEKVISSGEHNIYPNYYNLFQYEGEGRQNKENILVRQYGKDISESTTSHNTQRILEQGAVNPTKYLADSYLMTDGLPIDMSPLYENPNNTVQVFKNRDPRMGATFLKKGDAYRGSKPIFTVPNLKSHTTGFANRRYNNIEDWQNQKSYIDRSIIKYSEVLLNYAEATYELDGSISDEDLAMSINQLRDRSSVAMPHLTNSFVNVNNLDMRNEIRRERRVELALEGFRYWDLMRWKIAENVLPKPILGNKLFDDLAVNPKSVELDENRNIILQKSSFRQFDSNKDYLFPFPTDQLGLNPALEQNPGW